MNNKIIKTSTGEKIFVIYSYVSMGLYALSVLTPLLYILQLTLSGIEDASFRLLPKNFTVNNYIYVFKNKLIQRPFMNSVYLTSVSVLISMLTTVMFAYPLSRKELVARKFLNFLVVFPMVFSIGYLARYLVVRDLGLLNTYSAVILTGAISSFNLIIMRNFFQSIPDSLIESARIDGCSEVGILARIVIPLSTAAVASVTLFYLVDIWNEYFNIILYINDRKKHTLQVILHSLVMDDSATSSATVLEGMPLLNLQYTTIIIAIIPIMLVYPYLQKYFTKGILLGSIKG
ncbi:MAG: carbohydrate ABC transporter permease [Firmicutes bacterium]|nr:carbohydrate ABC transporter permease [Bacillota bacterium]